MPLTQIKRLARSQPITRPVEPLETGNVFAPKFLFITLKHVTALNKGIAEVNEMMIRLPHV